MYHQMPFYQNQYQSNEQVGFVSVKSEAEARNYPVAPGNSIMFKDENYPCIYTKTMGISQLDKPTFEKFLLVKEEPQEPLEPASKKDLEIVLKAVSEMETAIEELKEKIGVDET